MKLWKGRFSKEENSSAEAFNQSIEVDQRLYRQDIAGSIAHAAMLGRQGIIPREDAARIQTALLDILADVEAGRIAFTIEREDIHMNVESLLTERIGEAGKRLHTARSRNDQVATDLRLYQKERIAEVREALTALIDALAEIAERHRETVMPGYTHLQRAQPITLAKHLGAYIEMFRRDYARFGDCLKRTDSLPLGAGALAGVTYPIDRMQTAASLGFSDIASNTLDAVSDRDFAIEFAACASIAMMHLSRFCEELILWNTTEFGFVEMDDAFATGSSIMPQKKNPDLAELIRGKTGRVYGDLMALLTLMKGLPLAYNKDMQEDKPALFDAGDTLLASLDIFTKMIRTVEFRAGVMADAAAGGFMNATDAADYLVRKGLPFRDCHAVVGRLVLDCLEKKRALEDLTLEEWQMFSPLFEEDIFDAVDIRKRALV